jgi:hypothetical protein
MPLILNRGNIYTQTDVVLDGNEFQNCTFQNCRLIFKGEQPTKLSGNSISGDSRFVLAGAAQLTMNFLQQMAKPESGLSEVVKGSFPQLFAAS